MKILAIKSGVDQNIALYALPAAMNYTSLILFNFF